MHWPSDLRHQLDVIQQLANEGASQARTQREADDEKQPIEVEETEGEGAAMRGHVRKRGKSWCLS